VLAGDDSMQYPAAVVDHTSASPDDGSVEAVLERVEPNSVDRELIRSRLQAKLFTKSVAGPRFGRFELREHIGHGGMGVVYRAWDPQLERAVAIKIVDTGGLDSIVRERALREARSLAKLSHPNVITVFEAGLTDDRVWIAMELVSGTTMRDWLSRAPRPDQMTILHRWIAVGHGLIAVHEAGLVHRDIKPSNVLIADDERPRLIDFGLVRAPRVHAETFASPAESAQTNIGTGTSQTLGFVGTHAYAAPEQLSGGTVTAAADQYSYCSSLWESLCGRRPAPPEQREGTLVPLPEGVTLSPRVHRVLSRGLAADPRARFASIAELVTELEAAVHGPSHRIGVLLGAAALGAVAAGIMITRLDTDPEPPKPCAVDPRALDGTWDDARRAALRERFAGSEVEFSSTTVTAAERGFDDWATGWLAARQAACSATHVDGIQSEAALDLRNACLERKRRSVEVTIATILSADTGSDLQVVARTPELLASLPGLAECEDPRRVGEVEPLPEPGPLHDAIMLGYDALSEARALAAAGALDRAEARASRFASEFPDAMSHTPLRLELEALPAQLELQRGRVTRGIPTLVEVAHEAEARRLDELAASLLAEAAEAAAGHWSRPALERWLLAEADVALRRLDRPRNSRLASLRAAEAALLVDEGQLEQALTLHREARTLALDAAHHPQAEAQRWRIATTLGQLGRLAEARTELEAGREQAQQRWGKGAPMVGHYEFELAVLALETGDFEAASRRLDAADTIFRAAFGAGSFRVARVQFARAKLRMFAGELVEALALIDDAFDVYTRELDTEHEWLVELHEGRGVLRFYTGDLEGSIASYEAALYIHERVLGLEGPISARLYGNIGESQAALERLDEARASFDRALAIYARVRPEDHPDLAQPLKGRGQVALASGRAAESVKDLEQALRLQLIAGNEPLELADLRFSLARALAASEAKASPRAKALARQAREDFASRRMDEQVAAIDAWLRR
jgi:hypothetical protein